MSDDLFEPWEKLIPIAMLGRRLEVPENNVLLRQLQHVAPDIAWGRYCWNAECRYCEVTIRDADGREFGALACRLKATPGMQVVKAAPEIRYNCSAALKAAPEAG